MTTSLLRIETLTGRPIRINTTELRVRSQLFQLRLPMANGGLIWNRPMAIVVRTSDDREQILPILDWTRIVLLILTGLCCASLFHWLLSRLKKVES